MIKRSVLACLAVMLLSAVASRPVVASGLESGNFDFYTFSVPVPSNDTSLTVLSVEKINDEGVIVGYQSDPSGLPRQGYIRMPNGKVIPLIDSADTAADNTVALNINNLNIVTGYFLNTSLNQYQGFFYNRGTFKNYTLPGQPAGSATVIFAANDEGDFCGYYQDAPSYTPTLAFLNRDGKIQSFQFGTSAFTEAVSVNDFGYVGGIYLDSAGVWHGYIRDPEGNLTSVDVPGVTTASGFGTILLGINNEGWISGHFWDSALAEHGFLGIPKKGSYNFYQIDVPGATSTSGGALNDFGQVTGHWVDSAGEDQGYVATLDFGR
jgi:hypothetical protein